MPWRLSGQEVWQLFKRLAAEELGKGADCNENWVALVQKQAENLVAQSTQESGEVELHDAGSRQQGNAWMMHLAQAQSHWPPV